ncbi:MAG TPA: tetratricopeptide repeat protein, partial [Candidatus Polarisedimenticolia bacterium]|nr:tetratricopeptide repeat protein [Candidatus Polarisedimenticolia bacterium]
MSHRGAGPDGTIPQADAAPRPGPSDGPRDAAAWIEMGRGLMGTGDAADALWCLRRAIEIDADDASAWHLLARCFTEIDEPIRARRCL